MARWHEAGQIEQMNFSDNKFTAHIRHWAHHWGPHLGRQLVDTIYPPQCAACHHVVDEHGLLCSACWSQANFILPPLCDCCGTPFEFDQGQGSLCLRCLAKPPAFARARAALVYDDIARILVLSFKYGDRLDPALSYAQMMYRAGDELLAEADIIAPVPLHWTRLFKRRYNQSAILAQHLGRMAATPFAPDLLVRTRRTPSQAFMKREDRLRNVQRAFDVKAENRASLIGKNILLIDDVLTTGATVENCADTLYKAGAETVNVLTLARVKLPGQE
jgi:ComF family protein